MQNHFPLTLVVVSMALPCLTGCLDQPPLTRTAEDPPDAPREFRAAWVATVANIDWPSTRRRSVEEQQQEIISILDKAQEIHLNAIIFQVRTSADALYDSHLEPWSEYLTGTQGQPPEPYYDPLQMWINEAHRRGIELHAWFNPFRARQAGARQPESPDHISNTHPHLVVNYGQNQKWMDPGYPEAREHSLRVMMDVVRRYDVDGIHIDDYFYPYPVTEEGQRVDFPDDPSWELHGRQSGLERNDWRRQNINELVQRMYEETKRVEPHVKVGISPFGIPYGERTPEGISGFNQYENLYADAQLWLRRGWCDYWTPQLYWRVEQEGQAYPVLVNWWAEENQARRHLWVGNFTSRITARDNSWPVEELLEQIRITREHPGASGNVHFSMIALVQNRRGIADALRDGPYAEPALVPASPWPGGGFPATPWVRIRQSGDNLHVQWSPRWFQKVWLWGLYVQHGDRWTFRTVPGHVREATIEPHPKFGPPTGARMTAIDRFGQESRLGPRR